MSSVATVRGLHRLPLFTVDAFTSVPFSGNPAAICLDETELGLPPELMQKIAAEMNISETAFIKKVKEEDTFDGSARFGLRWFTPVAEVPLCGHATLASAATLFICRGNQSPVITFHTASGDLLVRREGETSIGMDLPLNKASPMDRDEVKGLIEAACSGLPVGDVQYSPSTKKLLLRLHDDVTRRSLEEMKPDITSFTKIHTSGKVKGVIVTLKGDLHGSTNERGESYDFLSRYFAPWVGIPEDPVTGSAHTVLAGYWASVLGKKKLFARQCSMRGGDLKIEVKDSERVAVTGEATVVLRGEITIPA